MVFRLQLACIFSLVGSVLAQQGDSADKGNVEQLDPVPVEKIPPAPFLNQEEALKSFRLAEGFVVDPITPDGMLEMPVALSIDSTGRAWVVEMTQYMVDLDGNDEELPTGRIKVLEDLNADGVFDRTTIFLDHLVMPRAVAVTSDGVLFASSGKLQFRKRDGLKPVGSTVVVDSKYAVGGNPEHQANGLLLGLDNWYYNAKSSKRYRRIDGKWITEKTKTRGQWGITQDDGGRLFHNSNSVLLHADQHRPNLFRKNAGFTPKYTDGKSAHSNRVFPARMTPGVNRAYRKGILDSEGRLVNATAAAGLAVYRGSNFPSEFYGSVFVSEPAGNLLKAIDVKYNDTNRLVDRFHYPTSEVLASTDEWFRPVNVYNAPDGSLWVLDMYFGLLQHKAYMTSYLRRQYASRSLDKPLTKNGRLYRLRFAQNALDKVEDASTKSTIELTQLLENRNGAVRSIAQRLLVDKVAKKSEKALFVEALQNVKSAQARLHALWVLESTGEIPQSFWRICLSSESSDLAGSALELAHLVTGEVNSTLLAYQPTTKAALSYSYALGKMATEQSMARAVSIFAEFSNQSANLRKVFVSASAGNLSTTHAQKVGDIALLKEFEKADKASKPKGRTTTPRIPNEHKLRIAHGKKLYLGSASCAACHGAEGQGQGELFPPLAPSNWVNDDVNSLLKVILHGLEGPIKVNGELYSSPQAMPAFAQRADLTDEDLACLTSYLRYMTHNKGGIVTAEQVRAVREQTKGRTKSYTAEELGLE